MDIITGDWLSQGLLSIKVPNLAGKALIVLHECLSCTCIQVSQPIVSFQLKGKTTHLTGNIFSVYYPFQDLIHQVLL